jgi:hypothetical protein
MMTRTAKIGGPAIIKKGSYYLYTEEDITVTTELTVTENQTSFFGKTSEHQDTVKHTITCKPAPMVTADVLTMIYGPFLNIAVGTRMYGASPDDIVIWTKAGQQHTYSVGAITGLPGLTFSAGMPLFDGDVTFTAIGDSSEAPSTAGHFAAIASVAFTDVSYDDSKEYQLVYPAAWGAAPFNAIETVDGFKIAFDLALEDDKNDSHGLYDATVTGFGVTATFQPIGITEAQVQARMGIQGTGAGRGVRRETFAADLVLTTGVAGDPTFTLYNCSLSGMKQAHGVTANNIGELSLVAQRKITTGAQVAMFAIGLTPVPPEE